VRQGAAPGRPEVDQQRAAARPEPGLRLLKVNVDEEQGLARRYLIRSIPTLAFLMHGNELARTSGAMTATDLEQRVRRVHPA
jgi:thioredoxin-like negative regulator of GroEL